MKRVGTLLAASAVMIGTIGVGSPAGGQGLDDLMDALDDPTGIFDDLQGSLEGLADCLQGADDPDSLRACVDGLDLDDLDLPDLDDLDLPDIPGLDGDGFCIEFEIDASVDAGVQIWRIAADVLPEEVFAVFVGLVSSGDNPLTPIIMPVFTDGVSESFEFETPLGSNLEAAVLVAPSITGDLFVDLDLSLTCVAAEDPTNGNGNGNGNGPEAAPAAPPVTGQPPFTG